jgi:dCMP deaminase
VRASWDQTWMDVARAIALRSPCTRQYGAVIVSSSNRILSTGYNGGPRGLVPTPVLEVRGHGDCRDWCPHATSDNPLPDYGDCFSIHAEANAIAFVDRSAMEGGCIYVTSNPCWMCCKQIANSGVARAVYRVDAQYRQPFQVRHFLERCGIEVVEWDWTT